MTSATPGTPGGRGDAGGPLWAAADVPVGAAVEPALLAHDEVYVATLLREFNAITPENAMKVGPVHPTARGWNLDPADRIVGFAEARRLRVHGHTLVWRATPQRVAEAIDVNTRNHVRSPWRQLVHRFFTLSGRHYNDALLDI